MKTLILLCCFAVAFARFSRECGENEHFEECGTACPLTCDNYQNPPKFCVLRCDIGCHCDEGYVRSTDGRCVKPEQCPAKVNHQVCGENEHFEECGTACPLTCDNYQNPPKVCVLRCDIGCHCDAGYVRSADGHCVKPEQCPAKVNHLWTFSEVCGENERFYECGTACPLTCENRDNPPKICPAMCVIGCQCEKGYVKTKDGRCVRPEDCPASAHHQEKTCFGEPDPGMCKAYFPSYYYDVQTGKCEKFIYGGCQGNGNRYSTEEECLEHCSGLRPKQLSNEVCDLPAETGVCRGFFPRYHFDRTTGRCEKFVYGGCGGNQNNFETVEDCQQACAHQAPRGCFYDVDVGRCKAHFVRYYFNKDTGKCEEFIYGGCGGNFNNFLEKQDCEIVCAARQAPTACLEDKVVGRCKAHFVRYYYNKDTGKCEEFVYGGCDGNSNNFLSQEDCEQVCAA